MPYIKLKVFIIFILYVNLNGEVYNVFSNYNNIYYSSVNNTQNGFIWVELPKNIKSVELANETIKRNVAISPGDPFYNKKRNVSTFRLSYSNCSVEDIDKGMKIIGETIEKMLKSK